VTSCDDLRLSLGAYALDGLEPAERDAVERHLRSCEDCRRAYGRLAPLPALLDRVEPGRTVGASPDRRLEHAVVAGFRDQGRARYAGRATTRRWRPALLGGVVGIVATVAVMAATGLLAPDRSANTRLVLAPAPGGSGSAQARLLATRSGTEIELDARLPPSRPGELYELWLVGPGGRVSAGTFVVDAGGRAEVRLTTAAGGAGYRRLGITREPDSVDPARNGPTMVVGRLTS
jgi:anti-sigma-K factor RskA